MQSVEEFERAVQLAFDASLTDQQLRAQATQYLCQLQQSPAAWGLCTSTLQQAPARFDHNVTFWCLSALVALVPQRLAELSDDEKTAFENLQFQWLARVLPVTAVPPFIKNKFAQLMVTTFQYEYPARWQNFFPSFFELLGQHEQFVDLLLRVLDNIDEQIVDLDFSIVHAKERDRSTMIKDAMRVQCVPDLTSSWYNILGMYHKTRPELAVQCLQTMQAYIDWIDISLLTTEHWMNLLFYLFNEEELRGDACDCIYELVSKRMEEPAPKLQLIQRLKVVDILPGVVEVLVGAIAVHGEDYPDELFACKVAKLCTTVGMELLAVIEKAHSAANSLSVHPDLRLQHAAVLEAASVLVDRSLPYLFSLFDCENRHVAADVLDFVTQYVAKLKREATLTDFQQQKIAELLRIIVHRVQYPPKYKFETPCDDYESEVFEHRKNNFVVLKNLYKRAPDILWRFVQQHLGEAVANAAAVGWARLEAILSVFYHMGEGVKAEEVRDGNGGYFHVMSLLTSSNLSHYGHQAVQLVYFELMDRYASYFVANGSALPGALEAFLDGRGVRNVHARVRDQCCYLLKCFVLALRPQVAPLTQQVLSAVKDILAGATHDDTVDDSVLGVDEQIHLYEVIGLLIGSDSVTYAQAVQCLEGVAGPLVANLQRAAGAGALGGNAPPARIAAGTAANEIHMLVYVTKGFSSLMLPVVAGERDRQSIGPLLTQLLEVVLQVFQAGVHHVNVRDKVLMFVHRMVELLGEGTADVVCRLATFYLNAANLTEAPKALRLPSQLVKRIREKAVPSLAAIFPTILQRVFELTSVERLAKSENVFSEECRQHAELQRNYYQLLFSLLSNGGEAVILCDGNRLLEQVIVSVIQGCSTHPEMEISRLCFQILLLMVEKWAAAEGFQGYALERILPCSFEALLRPHFDHRDGKARNVVIEVIKLHHLLLQRYGDACLAAVQGVLTAILRGNGLGVQQVVQQLQSRDTNAYKECLKSMAQFYHQQPPAS